VAEKQGTSRVVDVIADAIARTGVRFAFGHPGGEVVALIDALERAGVRFVLTHHETAAAFMAGGYGELTGRAGVCLATLGPGATNMVTGTASALLERAPMLAITGALAAGAPPGTTHQALDLNRLYAPVTKRSIAVSAGNAADAIATALAEATCPRPGPVHLSLAADVATAAAQPGGHHAGEHAGGRAHRDLPLPGPPSQAAMTAARRLLEGAARPAIVAGLGALDASAALTDLAERMGAAVAVLPKAKGVIAEDHPLFAGVLEMAGDDLVVDFLAGADALLLVGADPVEFDKPWRLKAPVVHVDRLANLDGYYPAEVELTGDVRSILPALADEGASAGWPVSTLQALREALRAHVSPSSRGLQPWQVVAAVRAALPRSAVATSDVGAHKFLVGQTWTTYHPRTFFMANGLSSMGYSIPVATAAWLIKPDRPVVAFLGDGGFGMYLGELETLTRLGADLLLVVFADRSLELIRRAALRRELEPRGTSFANPDFQAIGKAYGIDARQVTSIDELRAAVEVLVPRPGVRLLAAVVDGDDYRL
jgi:acetolactate synthase I/II/III large subunit